MSFIADIPKDYLLNDYITFFLFKYCRNISNKPNIKIKNFQNYHYKLINLILKLRFNDNNKIIKDNINNELKVILIKLNWLESNVKYIMDILNIYSILKGNYEREDILIELIEKTLNSQKIEYITNKAKNPIETKEVNECYYKLLASFCLSVTEYKINNNNIQEYFATLNNSLKIIKKLNDDLLIFLNEMYIIDELISIYEVLKLNDKCNINKINAINNNLKQNCEIIHKNEINKIEKLITNFKELDELIKDALNFYDKEYYNFLKYFYFK